MMTTMAAMMGTLPIAFGIGAGAESRRPLGLCVAGGLLLSQLLTLYITPVIYIYLDRLGDQFSVFGVQEGQVIAPGDRCRRNSRTRLRNEPRGGSVAPLVFR